MDKKSRLLELTLSKRTELIKLLSAAIILALGISLTANYITDFFKKNINLTFYIGLSLIFIVVIFFVITIIREAENEIKIEGLIAIENTAKTICSIPRYDFSENLSGTMRAVFLENEALKQYWEQDFQPKETEKIDSDNKVDSSENKEQKKNEGYYAIVRVSDDNEEKTKKKSDKILFFSAMSPPRLGLPTKGYEEFTPSWKPVSKV